MNDLHYLTIIEPAYAEFKDRGSRFIACAFPVDSVAACKERLAQLKKEHPKAAHHCFAYRLGLDGNSYRVSDDGEPSGSAGRPILGQIDSRQLTNILVVVVRYFGGTLLGVPGLIHAYKSSTQMAISSATVIEKPVLVFYRLQFDYNQMNEVMRSLKLPGCTIGKLEQGLFCLLETGIPKVHEQELLQRWTGLHQLGFEKMNGVE